MNDGVLEVVVCVSKETDHSFPGLLGDVRCFTDLTSICFDLLSGPNMSQEKKTEGERELGRMQMIWTCVSNGEGESFNRRPNDRPRCLERGGFVHSHENPTLFCTSPDRWRYSRSIEEFEGRKKLWLYWGCCCFPCCVAVLPTILRHSIPTTTSQPYVSLLVLRKCLRATSWMSLLLRETKYNVADKKEWEGLPRK